MVFDSSVWIDFFNGKKDTRTDLLDSLLESYDVVDIHMCPVIFQEVLQGIKRNEDHRQIRDLLFTCQFLYLDPYFVAEGASDLFRSLRTKGITIRKPNDCQIAIYTIHFKLDLVHSDKDFDKIANHSGFKVYRPK